MARALDVELMTVPGFSLDQLMELAGLSVAQALMYVFSQNATRILAVAGPGNNGGDALVAMRHLKHFGYDQLEVVYPKQSSGPLFSGLVSQLENLDIKVRREMPEDYEDKFDVILDGVFGFSFQATGVRPPFDKIMHELRRTKLPIVSIDIPSGWDVERGDVNGLGVRMPHVLISLTAPKLCAKSFVGEHHYLGGRFLPPKLAVKYGLADLPKFKGYDQFVKVVPSMVSACDKATTDGGNL